MGACRIQKGPSGIWTWVTVFNSFNDNHYTIHAPKNKTISPDEIQDCFVKRSSAGA